MDPYGAFGASKASGNNFDPITFFKNPQVIIRIVCWVFAIIVFASIGSQGWYEGKCQYNGSASHCRFGAFVGIIAFLACLAFLFADAKFENLVSVKDRKNVVLADLGFSSLWTFVWFLCFCALSNAWRKTPPSKLPPEGFGRNNVQAAIAFSLFSIMSWGCLTFLAWRRYKIGASQAFESTGASLSGIPAMIIGGSSAIIPPSPFASSGGAIALPPSQQLSTLPSFQSPTAYQIGSGPGSSGFSIPPPPRGPSSSQYQPSTLY